MQENVPCVGFYQFLIQMVCALEFFINFKIMTFLSDSYTKLKKLVLRTKKEISINWFIWLKV